MKKISRRSFLTVCGAAAAAAALTACGGSASSASGTAASATASSAAESAAGTLSGNVATGGSTSMKNVIAALTEGFAEVQPGVTVSYDPTGSGAGITGATDKSDKSAKKTWKFREVSWGSVCNMGAHGGWKYTSAGYTPESNFAWWANVTAAEAGDQSMVFEFDGNKMKTYDASGNLKAEGTFSFTHEKPEDGVLGELITSIPTIGGNYDDNGQSVGSNKFWLLTLDENYITIYHPGKYSGGVDWDDSGWYAYFKTEAGTDSE